MRSSQYLFAFVGLAVFVSADHGIAAESSTAQSAAVDAEIMRRARLDFPLTAAEVLDQIRQRIPDASADDVARWTKEGKLHGRKFDDHTLYFRNAAANLFRLSEEARKREPHPTPPAKKFDLSVVLRQIVADSEASTSPEINPIRVRINYELAVKPGNPHLKPGAKVRAWLPFPQEYRQQRDVKLIKSEPSHKTIAPVGTPQRSIYFEEIVNDPAKPPKFNVEFEFTTSAYCPQLDPAAVKPYDESSETYREFTAERLPHIRFTPEVRKLAAEIVGNETNPLKKAELIFHWVSKNIPWVSEMEYSTIPSISAKGLEYRCGDCGVQGLTFVTLCRAAGVPARWQSGWGLKPGEENMHDWSEIYIEPYGWLPADASYGVRTDPDLRVQDYFCGHIDPYRLIVNLDYGQPFDPPKTSFRSEPVDFQRGEVEIDGQNLYFNEWEYNLHATTTPLEKR